jgi:YHS domain-containing protein
LWRWASGRNMCGHGPYTETVDTNIDLVCGMTVEEETPRFFTEYNGRVYPFCSAECKRKFDDHPDAYIQENAKRELEAANSEQ